MPCSFSAFSLFHSLANMGILSCFAPLLGQASSAASVYSDSTLVGFVQLVKGEKGDGAGLNVVHHAVSARDALNGRNATKAKLEALRQELDKEGLQA